MYSCCVEHFWSTFEFQLSTYILNGLLSNFCILGNMYTTQNILEDMCITQDKMCKMNIVQDDSELQDVMAIKIL